MNIINENIYRFTMPYKDIFTTIYVVKTPDGVLLFDAASYDEDVENYIIPALDEIGIENNDIKYIFISHNHKDHAGALGEVMKKFPSACIVTRSETLKEAYGSYNVILPDDGKQLLGVLKVVTIPGHTMDSEAIFDTRTKTLISGDCLQLYGIFGSGLWGSNINFPSEHKCAVEKLKNMDIENILTAHDYHPMGYMYTGKNEVLSALNSCIEPLLKMEELIKANADKTSEEIAQLYNSSKLPKVGAHVVEALRKAKS